MNEKFHRLKNITVKWKIKIQDYSKIVMYYYDGNNLE